MRQQEEKNEEQEKKNEIFDSASVHLLANNSLTGSTESSFHGALSETKKRKS